MYQHLLSNNTLLRIKEKSPSSINFIKTQRRPSLRNLHLWSSLWLEMTIHVLSFCGLQHYLGWAWIRALIFLSLIHGGWIAHTAMTQCKCTTLHQISSLLNELPFSSIVCIHCPSCNVARRLHFCLNPFEAVLFFQIPYYHLDPSQSDCYCLTM